jgi:hypothetical protein
MTESFSDWINFQTRNVCKLGKRTCSVLHEIKEAANYTSCRFFVVIQSDSENKDKEIDYLFNSDCEENTNPTVRAFILQRAQSENKYIILGLVEYSRRVKASSLKKAISIRFEVERIDVQLFGCNNIYRAVKFLTDQAKYPSTQILIISPLTLSKTLLGLEQIKQQLQLPESGQRELVQAARDVAELIAEEQLLSIDDALIELPMLMPLESLVRKNDHYCRAQTMFRWDLTISCTKIRLSLLDRV